MLIIIWSVDMEGQRLWSQELIQSISRTAYFYVCFASSENCSQMRHRPEIISLENVTFGLEKFGFRIHRKLENVSNLHFSEV